MVTYRDLALPTRKELWRELRGLRVSPPGAAATEKARGYTFQSALGQAQEFMEAAAGAGYATRAVQLFYGLSQAGRAIAAASTELPCEIMVPDKDNPGQMKPHVVNWALRGHGITAPSTSANQLSKVTVCADWTGLFPGVALACGVPCLVPGEKVKLGDLWPLIWETRIYDGKLRGESVRPALYLEGGTRSPNHRNTGGLFSSYIGGFPDEVRQECDGDDEKLKKYLNAYPSLIGWGRVHFLQANAPMEWEPFGSAWKMKFSWPEPFSHEGSSNLAVMPDWLTL